MPRAATGDRVDRGAVGGAVDGDQLLDADAAPLAEGGLAAQEGGSTHFRAQRTLTPASTQQQQPAQRASACGSN
jgi:hypothetical protein